MALDSTPAAPANIAPVADAGAERSVLVGDRIALDGSRSSDADGDPLTYEWSLTSRPAGSNAVLSGADTVAPTFTADAVGAYLARLIVRDGFSSSLASTVTIIAEAVPPGYSPDQLRIVSVIEAEIAKVTTHRLDPSGQMPGWVAYFEARQSWPEFRWRQEMRRIAIEDGSRYGWNDATSRSRFTATGALISLLRCEDFFLGDVSGPRNAEAVVDGLSMTAEGETFSLEPEVTYVDPAAPPGDAWIFTTTTLERSGQKYLWSYSLTPPSGRGYGASAEIGLSGQVLRFGWSNIFEGAECVPR